MEKLYLGHYFRMVFFVAIGFSVFRSCYQPLMGYLDPVNIAIAGILGLSFNEFSRKLIKKLTLKKISLVMICYDFSYFLIVSWIIFIDNVSHSLVFSILIFGSFSTLFNTVMDIKLKKYLIERFDKNKIEELLTKEKLMISRGALLGYTSILLIGDNFEMNVILEIARAFFIMSIIYHIIWWRSIKEKDIDGNT